jgi:hypothetical protein
VESARDVPLDVLETEAERATPERLRSPHERVRQPDSVEGSSEASLLGIPCPQAHDVAKEDAALQRRPVGKLSKRLLERRRLRRLRVGTTAAAWHGARERDEEKHDVPPLSASHAHGCCNRDRRALQPSAHMSIFLIFIVVAVLLLIVLNTKRWKGLLRGAKDARRGIEEEIKSDD